jgi:hypothetical protein
VSSQAATFARAANAVGAETRSPSSSAGAGSADAASERTAHRTRQTRSGTDVADVLGRDAADRFIFGAKYLF